jgi:hypothetical protein
MADLFRERNTVGWLPNELGEEGGFVRRATGRGFLLALRGGGGGGCVGSKTNVTGTTDARVVTFFELVRAPARPARSRCRCQVPKAKSIGREESKRPAGGSSSSEKKMRGPDQTRFRGGGEKKGGKSAWKSATHARSLARGVRSGRRRATNRPASFVCRAGQAGRQPFPPSVHARAIVHCAVHHLFV